MRDVAETAKPEQRQLPQWRKKSFWLMQVRTWHWITGAVTLVGMLLFAVTGITLNHAGQIEARLTTTSAEGVLPAELLTALESQPTEGEGELPADLARWVESELGASVRGRTAEWSQTDIYVGMPRPGGDAWLEIDRTTGDAMYESTGRGTIAYLNDLHKGRNAGPAWSWFIDIFSVAAVIFCVTGLWLLYLYAPGRKITWPLVGAGFVIPALIAMLLIH